MPVSVVVGGQYGSEGKGKVALEMVRRDPSISIVVRPGGTNSGHTAYTCDGKRVVLRQLPAAALDGNVDIVLPAGSYIDVGLLKRELAETGIPPSRVMIDPRANVIRAEHVRWEDTAALTESIGSTGSGTGGAVIARIARMAGGLPISTAANEVTELLPFIRDVSRYFSEVLRSQKRILIEGTQGFGLSPIHGDSWPKATSRDTIAAAFLSESGLSPLEVDEVILVLRCHPIRVAGDSGPITREVTWDAIASEAGAPPTLQEFTSVTGKLRRVGHFDAELVRRAIDANSPTKIVLNHLDYVDWNCRSRGLTERSLAFLRQVELGIGRPINLVGLSETKLVERQSSFKSALEVA